MWWRKAKMQIVHRTEGGMRVPGTRCQARRRRQAYTRASRPIRHFRPLEFGGAHEGIRFEYRPFSGKQWLHEQGRHGNQGWYSSDGWIRIGAKWGIRNTSRIDLFYVKSTNPSNSTSTGMAQASRAGVAVIWSTVTASDGDEAETTRGSHFSELGSR